MTFDDLAQAVENIVVYHGLLDHSPAVNLHRVYCDGSWKTTWTINVSAYAIGSTRPLLPESIGIRAPTPELALKAFEERLVSVLELHRATMAANAA
jgi:hypothetical protein